MAEWKKVIVSGSAISELNNDAGYVASVGGGIVSGSSQITMGGDLSGTADNAQLGSGVVGTTELAADAVTAAKLADNAVVTANIVNANVTTAKIADDAVTQAKIANDAVGADQLAADSVVEASIVDGSVSNAKLAANAVATSNIVDANVTEAKIAGGAVTAAKIGANAVTETKILNGAVTSGKIGVNAVVTAGISNGAVTAAKLDSAIGLLSGSAQIESDINDLADARIAAANVTDLSDVSSAGSGQIITTTERNKLGTIEENADVTDATNVAAAGALMAADVDSDITTFALPANTTISTFGASLVDDASAAAARTTLGVDEAGTDNSTNVTLVTTSHDYLSIAGQAITLGTIDISDDTNLAVSDTSGQTGINLTLSGDTISGVVSGLTTTSNVTFANIVATGDLEVQGTLTSVNTTNLNVEDQLVLLSSGSATAKDVGFIFGGSNSTANSGDAFFYDSATDRPAWSSTNVAWNATAITPTAFIPRVFDTDAAHTPIDERGSMRLSGTDIFIYV